MKLQTTVLGAALLLSANAFADDKTTTTSSTETTTSADRYVHGETVREAAQRDPTGAPLSPPGATVSATARTQGDFMRLDTDKDGRLSADELSANAELSAQLDALDTDGDGYISRTEFNNSLASSDDDMDDDFDNLIDEED
jgi:hypothetical protein